MLLDDNLITPIAADDTAITDQAKPVLINILTNDSNPSGIVQLGTTPQAGTIIIIDTLRPEGAEILKTSQS